MRSAKLSCFPFLYFYLKTLLFENESMLSHHEFEEPNLTVLSNRLLCSCENQIVFSRLEPWYSLRSMNRLTPWIELQHSLHLTREVDCEARRRDCFGRVLYLKMLEFRIKQSLSHFVTAPFTQGSLAQPNFRLSWVSDLKTKHYPWRTIHEALPYSSLPPRGRWHGVAVTEGACVTLGL